MEPRKSISRRQLLKTAAVGTGALILAACGGTPTATPAPVATKPPAAGPTPTTAPAAKTAVSVTLWRTAISAQTEKLGDLAARFRTFYDKTMKEMVGSNVTINHVEVPGAELLQKIQASITAGAPPDVSWIDQTWVAPLLSMDGLRPMPDGLIDVKARYGAFTADWFKMGPKKMYYCLPDLWWERGIFYNVKLMKEFGYELKDIPKKTSELIKFAQTMTKWDSGAPEPKVSGLALAGGATFDFYTTAIDNMGGFWWLDDTHSGFGEPVWEEAWRLTLDCFDKYKLDARTGLDNIARFESGAAAMLFQQSWVGGRLRANQPQIEWGIIPCPTPNGGPPYGWKEAHVGWSVPSIGKGAQLDAAWQVFKALNTTEWTSLQAEASHCLPGPTDGTGKAPFTADNPWWAGLVEKHKVGNSVCCGFWPSDLWKCTNEPWEAVYKNNADVTAQLKVAQQCADAILPKSPEIQDTILTKKDYIDNPSWTDSKIPIKSWWDGKRRSYLAADQQ